jgi:hypothetical protein
MADHKKFPEQTAPDKNTDRAFVKVNKDGSPQIPGRENETKERIKEKPVSRPSRK